MVKKVLYKSSIQKNAALVVLGWFCFVAGVLIYEPLAKLPLLAIARVLP
jgi:hypothetical protein